jgi:hypothetical protein
MSDIAAQHKSGLEGSLVATSCWTSTYRDIVIYRDEMPSKQYFMETLTIGSCLFKISDGEPEFVFEV